MLLCVPQSGKIQEVVDYLHERKVPADLFTRTCTQYEYYLSRKSAFDEDIILGELTESLRQEVCMFDMIQCNMADVLSSDVM